MKFFTPKFVKIRNYLGIFITFGSDFQIKLTIYRSSLGLTCVNMSELDFFVKGALCTKHLETPWNLQIFLKKTKGFNFKSKQSY
jgi:hypothetical protein